MVKIKLLYAHIDEKYDQEYMFDGYDFQHHSMTDWIEVTQEQKNEIIKNKQYVERPSGTQLIILEQAPKEAVKQGIADILAGLKKKKKEAAEAKKKREEAKKVREAKKAANELKRKQKKLAELKAELGET